MSTWVHFVALHVAACIVKKILCWSCCILCCASNAMLLVIFCGV